MRNLSLWLVFSNSEIFFLKEARFGGFKKNLKFLTHLNKLTAQK